MAHRHGQPDVLTKRYIDKVPEGVYRLKDHNGHLVHVRCLVLNDPGKPFHGRLIVEVLDPKTGQWLEPEHQNVSHSIMERIVDKLEGQPLKRLALPHGRKKSGKGRKSHQVTRNRKEKE